MNARWIVIWFCLMLLGACAPPQVPAAPTAQPMVVAPSPTAAASSELNVTLKRGGGLAGRNEIFILKQDGTVMMGEQIKQADGGATAAAKLAEQIVATGIYDVAPGRYMPVSLCCDRYLYDLALVRDGQSYHYVTMDGSENAPPPLFKTLGLIQQYITAAR